MATLTVTEISRDGVDVAGVTPTAGTGDEWANTGRELILVANASGGSINVTLDLKGTIDGLAITDRVVAVGAGVTKAIGPFPTGIYNDSSTGRAKATCSATSSITIKALKLPSV
jgi:hypothetical protein